MRALQISWVPLLLALAMVSASGAGDARSLAVANDAIAFAKYLATLPPDQRAKTILVWWEVREAEYNPSPQTKSIRFLDEMIGCGESAIPVLRSAIVSSNAEVRVGASCALNWLVPKALPALPELLRGIEDPDWRVRENSTLAISKYGHLAEPAIPAMIRNLQHDSAMLRGWTVFSLGYLGEVSKPAIPHLVEMLRHPEVFQVGWKPQVAVDALSRILFRHFASTQEVMEWWKSTGKELFADKHEDRKGSEKR